MPAEFFSKGDAVLLLSPNKSLHFFYTALYCVLGRISVQNQETCLLKVISSLGAVLGKF